MLVVPQCVHTVECQGSGCQPTTVDADESPADNHQLRVATRLGEALQQHPGEHDAVDEEQASLSAGKRHRASAE